MCTISRAPKQENYIKINHLIVCGSASGPIPGKIKSSPCERGNRDGSSKVSSKGDKEGTGRRGESRSPDVYVNGEASKRSRGDSRCGVSQRNTARQLQKLPVKRRS